MTEYAIIRDGLAPLTFTGELIAESDGRLAAGRKQNRWHNLHLYRTAGDRYVLQISYHTRWDGELDHTEAREVAADNVETELRAYDPTVHVQGFPRHKEYAERQATLLLWINRRYQQQVGELLAEVSELAEHVE